MAARLKDLRQKLLQGSPSNSPSRSENATLYSDCCDTKCPSPIPEKVTNSATEVVVVSDSNDDDDNPIIEISSEEEEDVTTTIMNFNKSQKVGKTKAIRRSQKERRSSSSSDDDIHVIPIKKKVTRENPKYQKPKKIQKRISSRNGGIRKRRSSENEYGAATSSSDDESVVVKQVSKPNRTKKISGGGSDASPNDSIATIGENYACSDSFGEYDGEEADIVRAGIKQYSFFSPKDCTILEQMIDDEIVAKIDTFKQCTVDRAPLRNKYFFGEGYTYGNQMRRKGPGMEELYPKGFVDGIPEWVIQFVVHPLEKAGIIPKGFINSCVINDYLTGGCITSHIDPKQLFDRPIYTISLMSDSALSFGVRFSFKPIRCSEPVYRVPLKRGCITAISGYAADKITHCVRPEDVRDRRAVIILRRVFDDAPRLQPDDYMPWKESGTSTDDRHSKRSGRRSAPVYTNHHRDRRSTESYSSDHRKHKRVHDEDSDEQSHRGRSKKSRHSDPSDRSRKVKLIRQ